MMTAPLRCANARFARVNSLEPVKNTKRARSKLSSSTGWMTAGSPPASVSVPAASSSSSRRKSDGGEAAFFEQRFQLGAEQRRRTGDYDAIGVPVREA